MSINGVTVKYALALLLCLLALPTFAWDNNHELFVGAWSKHTISMPDDDDGNWNETHRPIGYRYKNFGLLKFDNSWDRESYAPLYFTKDRTFWKFKYDWALGFSTGYKDVNGLGIMPYIFPRVELLDVKFMEVQLWATPIVSVLTVTVPF